MKNLGDNIMNTIIRTRNRLFLLKRLKIKHRDDHDKNNYEGIIMINKTG